jgi:hypothetical protein
LARLIPTFLAQDDPTAVREVLDALTERLKSRRRVIARLIAEHGFEMVARFLTYPAAQPVSQWRADLFVFERHFPPAAAGTEVPYQRAIELSRKHVNLRETLARLIEDYGLDVIVQLLAYRDDVAIRALFERPAPRKRGRPAGSYARDPFAYASATVVSDLGITPVQLLNALGWDASTGSADHPRLHACRLRGDDLREGHSLPIQTSLCLSSCTGTTRTVPALCLLH